MKAVLCSHFCTADELELADIEEPHAGPGEAVVRVKSAALNFFDTLIIAGKYQHKPPFPFSPAAEFAGVVESIGAGVKFATVVACSVDSCRQDLTLIHSNSSDS